MSYSLNSLKGVCIEDYIGTIIGATKGDTRSLDNGLYAAGYPTEGRTSCLQGDLAQAH